MKIKIPCIFAFPITIFSLLSNPTLLRASEVPANPQTQLSSEFTDITESSSDTSDQINSVSQLSDVQTSDWAFKALRSLVERYACIAGYPDGAFRGNRAITRYEFAAGLHACLDRVQELIATSTASLVSKEDLATLHTLQEQFAPELATLRGRVDVLEAHAAELESNQFSTTTKLLGEAIFAIADVFGGKAADQDRNPNNNPKLQDNLIFADRVRLNLVSSFTQYLSQKKSMKREG